MLHRTSILRAISLLVHLAFVTVHSVSGLSVPIFTQQPTNTIAVLGLSIDLTCQATGDPPPTYIYTHNNSPVANDTSRGVTIANGKLTLEKYQASDAGQYVCTATNSEGSINSNTATLRTAYISNTFATYPISQVLVAHSSLSLTCTIDSLPNADITFVHNNNILRADSSPRFTTVALSKGSRLDISDTHFSDNGTYYCGAMNPINSGFVIGATITVNVQGPPEFVTLPSSQSIPEGLAARLDCVVVAIPAATSTWTTPGGTDLPSTISPRFSVLSNNSLMISNVQKTDAGLYTCTASNRFGSPAASSRLTVLDPLSKPSFTTSPASVTALSNSSITMNCVASGNPSPTITWTRGNEALRYNSRIVFLASQGVLRISFIIPDDEAQYTCTATNSEGSVTSSAVLTVQVLPAITSSLPNLVLNEGASLQVDCTATGKPSPSIVFGHPSSASAITSVSGRLTVASLARTDAGQYSCTATNVVGRDKKEFTLKVQGIPYFIRKPNNVAVTTGATVTFYCDIAGDPVPTKTWTRSNRTPLPMDPRFTAPSTGELQIQTVIKTDAGTYECRASNSFGEVVASGALSVHVFPSFSQRPADIEVVQGGDAVFECVTTGSPSPTYGWTFPNGTVIAASPNGRFLSDGGMLTIKRLTAADQGRYTCIATNAAGYISSAATVTMLTLPTFTTKPSDTIVIASQTVSFSCSATGINQPTISWVLVPNNGVELPLTSARYLVTSTGTLTIPGIEKTDEGIYQCRASNRAGTMSLQARLTVHIKPVAYLLETTLTLISGQNGEWRCNITEGDPTPTFKWTHASESSLTDVNRFVDSRDGLLTLKSVQTTDAGQYTCQATNYVGSSTATGTLNIQVIPTISFVAAKPVVVGGSALLECNATGVPMPTVRWRIRTSGKVIRTDSRYSQTSSGSLVITNVRGSDQQAYECQAVNAAGTASRNVNLKLILQPGAVSKPTATNVGVHEVTLTWTISDSGGSPITGHQIEYFLQTSWRKIPTTYDGNNTQNITGLTGNTEYFFRVTAINKVGPSSNGVPSDPVKTLIGAPSAPQDFKAVATGPNSVELTWMNPQVSNGPLQYYEIDYESRDIEQIASTTRRHKDLASLAYTVTRLDPYISYVFRIRGNNGGEELAGEYATATARTNASVATAPPQNVRLEAAGEPVITVTWEPPSPIGRNGPISGYYLYYRIVGSEGETKRYFSEELRGETTSYKLEAQGNVRYGVVLSMFNDFGEGPNSTEVQLTAPSAGFETETSGASLGEGKQAAIAVGVVCFVLLCTLIVASFYYRYKMRTAVLSMTRGDEELGNEDAVGGGKERGGDGYLPDSPEVRSKNVRGNYRERQSQKRASASNVAQATTTTTATTRKNDTKEPDSPRYVPPPTTTAATTPGNDTKELESPGYAQPGDLLLPRTKSDDSRGETAGVDNAVYAQVDLQAKHRQNDDESRRQEENMTEEATRRATQEAAKREEEVRHKQLEEQQRAQKEQKRQEQIRQKEAEAMRKREEKKRREEETRRMKEIMKQDRKNQSAREKAAKKRGSKSARPYNLSSDPGFGTAGLF